MCSATNCSAVSSLERMSTLQIDDNPPSTRLTGIVCTIGPASCEVDVLVEMIEAGMNIVRLNLSHGSHEYHAAIIQNAREAIKVVAEEKNDSTKTLAIALDNKGPEILTGWLKEDPSAEVELVTGKTIKLTTDSAYAEESSAEILYIDYKNIAKVVPVGSLIYIDDGLISLIVKSVENDDLLCEIKTGGMLGSQKGINLPGAEVDLPALSEKDELDLLFGVEQDVDMIFASFVRNAAGVQEIRKALGDEGKHIKIVSKIENHEGVKKIDEIIEASDGIMIARGDLGIEIPTEKVFVAQKMIIAKCNIAGKPVICATQMLDSMTEKPTPTRAESSDVANAVLDGADCVMLSGESARGNYPVFAVQIMNALCGEAEAAICYRTLFSNLLLKTKNPVDISTSTAISAVDAALNCLAAAIIVLTATGSSAHRIAKYRPSCPILAVTRDERAARQSLLYRGIVPLYYQEERQAEWTSDVEKQIIFAIECGKRKGMVKAGDNVVIVTGWTKEADTPDTMTILVIE